MFPKRIQTATLGGLSDIAHSLIKFVIIIKLAKDPVYSHISSIALVAPALGFAISDVGFSILAPGLVDKNSLGRPASIPSLLIIFQIIIYIASIGCVGLFYLFFGPSVHLSPSSFQWFLPLSLLYLSQVCLPGWAVSTFRLRSPAILALIAVKLAALAYALSCAFLSLNHLNVIAIACSIPAVISIIFCLVNIFLIRSDLVALSICIFKQISFFSISKSFAFGVYSAIPIYISLQVPLFLPSYILLDKFKSIYAVPFSLVMQTINWSTRPGRMMWLFFCVIGIANILLTSTLPFFGSHIYRFLGVFSEHGLLWLFAVASCTSVLSSLLMTGLARSGLFSEFQHVLFLQSFSIVIGLSLFAKEKYSISCLVLIAELVVLASLSFGFARRHVVRRLHLDCSINR